MVNLEGWRLSPMFLVDAGNPGDHVNVVATLVKDRNGEDAYELTAVKFQDASGLQLRLRLGGSVEGIGYVLEKYPFASGNDPVFIVAWKPFSNAGSAS